MRRVSTIEAAGGVLWRQVDSRLGVEVALVHRPRRADWSLPKGKLVAHEHPLLGALREVREETGHDARVGSPLGALRYRQAGTPKRVRYWALSATTGKFVAGREIDDLVWLPPDAAWRLVRRRDRPVIDRFWSLRADLSRPLLLVRPGSATSRWTGDESQRPLGKRGHRQAAALAQLLSAFDVRRTATADLTRCIETMIPYTRDQDAAPPALLPMRERGRPSRRAAEELAALVHEGIPTAVCAEHDALRWLSRRLSTTGRSQGIPPPLPRGGLYALHLDGRRPRRLVTAERVRPAG